MADTPRGIRNNNPGNIRIGERWRGLSDTQTDDSFCQFQHPVYGIRALAKLLANYQRLHGLGTLEQILSRYAPPTENDTDSYVAHARAAMDVGPGANVILTDGHELGRLVKVIIRHENGMQPYPDWMIEDGVELALL